MIWEKIRGHTQQVATFRRSDMLWDEDSRRNLLVWFMAERTAHEITDEAHR